MSLRLTSSIYRINLMEKRSFSKIRFLQNQLALQVSWSIYNALSGGQSSSDDMDTNHLISFGGIAGNWKEQHHPTAVKKSFDQFRKDAFAGMGGIRNRKLRQRKPQDDLPIKKSSYRGAPGSESI